MPLKYFCFWRRKPQVSTETYHACRKGILNRWWILPQVSTEIFITHAGRDSLPMVSSATGKYRDIHHTRREGFSADGQFSQGASRVSWCDLMYFIILPLCPCLMAAALISFSLIYILHKFLFLQIPTLLRMQKTFHPDPPLDKTLWLRWGKTYRRKQII